MSIKAFKFSEFNEQSEEKDPFKQLLDVFLQLLSITGGNASEALQWMNQLDQQYQLSSEGYSMGDFIDDLKKKGYLKEDGNKRLAPTGKSSIEIRKSAFKNLFSSLNKGSSGDHATKYTGSSPEKLPESRPYQFGDDHEQINYSESIKNAYIDHGVDHFHLSESNLSVHERTHQTRTSTVLMIDISHSMILYGEDRITPAKKVAMALSELIKMRYPKDSLDIVVFGNEAWTVSPEEIAFLQVGPYHTNTVAGLELAMKLLRKKRDHNKQIFMITDGKPSCIKRGKKLYKNSFGLDKMIIQRTLSLAKKCKSMDIPVTTFMIAQNPDLVAFVRKFTEVNNGAAYFCDLNNLGDSLLRNFWDTRR